MSTAAKLKDYFEQIYQDTEGYVYAPVKRDGRIQGFMIPWPRRADGLVEHVLRYAADESVEVNGVNINIADSEKETAAV